MGHDPDPPLAFERLDRLRRDRQHRRWRRGLRFARHTRRGPQRAPGTEGTLAIWHTTQPRPWDRKRRNRAAAKRARASRKANR